jgi:crossover junction endodeoxyribonuclease RuvC
MPELGRKRSRNLTGAVVLGVDPGTLATGYGIVERSGSSMKMISAGVIRCDRKLPLTLRLNRIHRELRLLISEHLPDEFAIESAFYSKNAQSALKLGHARGVALLAAAQTGIPTFEYTPREIKKAVCGNGHASKEQIQYMVRSILTLPPQRMASDTSDAIATAICHIQRRAGKRKSSNTWGSFVKSHPERVHH